ncbi:MAG: tetratricopeptide repeat protein [Verrucomicrobiota bacterium]
MLILWSPLGGEIIPREQALRVTLQEALTAYEEGRYADAAASWQALADDYAELDYYQEVLPRLLPYWAVACLRSGQPALAADLLEQHLEASSASERMRPQIWFTLGEAYFALEEFDKAARAYRTYREHTVNQPEALLSVLREAEIHVQAGQLESGLIALLDFANDERVPPTLRSQARLRAIQAAQANGMPQRGADILLGGSWAITTMPELAILAYAALQTGQYLSAEGDHAGALRAYRMVPPFAQLVSRQQDRLAQLRRIFEYRYARLRRSTERNSFWAGYFEQVMARVERELARLEASQDYTPSWQLKLGEAFLRSSRPREAVLIYEHLRDDPALTADWRARAHYRLILAHQELEDWLQTLQQAADFRQRYRDHAQIPETLTIESYAQMMLNQPAAVVERLSTALDAYPEHRLAARWYFMRGYAALVGQDYLNARSDFQSALQHQPPADLALSIRLWDALSYVMEKHYGKALERFHALSEDAEGSRLEAEIAYRQASAQYAAKDYAPAQVSLEAFLQNYPGDSRTDAAHALLGDALLAQQDYDAAFAQYGSILPDAPGLYSYAVFQQGRILRALRDYQSLEAHFQAYLAGADNPRTPRLAEALGWIGWAASQRGQTGQALAVYLEAWERFGDQLEAGDLSPLLDGIRKLRGDALYSEWLETSAAEALGGEAFTRYARLMLYQAKHDNQAGEHDRSARTIYAVLDKVPLIALDDAGLAQAGLLLVEDKLALGGEALQWLLERFPDSPHRGAAWYGLASAAWTTGDKPAALQYLERFQAETPFHLLAGKALLMQAELLQDKEAYNEAERLLTQGIGEHHLRGHDRARALLLLAEGERQQGELSRAIAYQQRVYTLYRAYPELLAQAYLGSALAFHELGDYAAASQTLQEMARDSRLHDLPEMAQANHLLQHWGVDHEKVEAVP